MQKGLTRDSQFCILHSEFCILVGLVPEAGVEPATSWSTAKRSNHLSYSGTRRE